MMLEQLDYLPHLIVEARAFVGIARGIVEARLLAKARREDEAERRYFALKPAKTFVQPHHHILGGQITDAGDLFGGVRRLAKEGELQPDRADIRLRVQSFGHVIRSLAMRVARRQDELGQIEDLQIAVEAIVIAEADQTIDVGNALDRQRAGSV